MSKYVPVTHNEHSTYHNDSRCTHSPTNLKQVGAAYVETNNLTECEVCELVIISLPRNKADVYHSKDEPCKNVEFMNDSRTIPKTKARRLDKRLCKYCGDSFKQKRNQDMSYQDVLKENNTLEELKRAND